MRRVANLDHAIRRRRTRDLVPKAAGSAAASLVDLIACVAIARRVAEPPSSPAQIAQTCRRSWTTWSQPFFPSHFEQGQARPAQYSTRRRPTADSSLQTAQQDPVNWICDPHRTSQSRTSAKHEAHQHQPGPAENKLSQRPQEEPLQRPTTAPGLFQAHRPRQIHTTARRTEIQYPAIQETSQEPPSRRAEACTF